MKVSEIFKSIQGEGHLAGVVSAFVRLSGCPLRCKWCDTAYAWDTSGGSELVIAEILGRVDELDVDYVVITGGEPLMSEELPELMEAFRNEGYHITLETSATDYIELECDIVSISPKLSNSYPDKDNDFYQQHIDNCLDTAVIQDYLDNYQCQLKFVVSDKEDMPEVFSVLDKLDGILADDILLMPQAKTASEYQQIAPKVAELCIDNDLSFSPRLHISLWDGQKGK